MPARLPVVKTLKLWINGAFVRSESGRSLPVKGSDGRVIAHIAHASRKDLRDAVESSRLAQPAWAERTPCNRGQILYRMAEMVEGRRDEFIRAIDATRSAATRPKGGKRGRSPTTKRRKFKRSAARDAERRATRDEVSAAIDRLVCFAGWCDKFAHILGCQNPVSGPYYNFSTPEPVGIVGIVAPDEPAFLGMISLLAPPLCAGNAAVVISSDRHPLSAAVFGEVCATSDLPAGVVNILTGKREELLEPLATHREVNAICAANVTPVQRKTIELGAAENLKRVRVIKRKPEEWFDPDRCESPTEIEPFIEIKTIWHPSGV